MSAPLFRREKEKGAASRKGSRMAAGLARSASPAKAGSVAHPSSSAKAGRAFPRALRGMLLSYLFPIGIGALVLSAEPTGYALFLFAAVALHECGHLAAFLMLGEPLPFFRARGFGFLMTPATGVLSYRREMAVAAAGPLLNLLTAAVLIPTLRCSPTEANFCFFAINLLTALFNLLPIAGFDGGRVLAAGAALLLPPRAAHLISASLSFFFSLLFYFLTLFLFFYGDGGSYPLLLGFFLVGAALQRGGELFPSFERKREQTGDFPK